MKRRVRRSNFSKERLLMVISSVLVLATLSVTGLWLGKDKRVPKEDYIVDLSSIENQTNTLEQQIEAKKVENIEKPVENMAIQTENTAVKSAPGDDLDYDPYFQETSSQKIENPDTSKSMSEGADDSDEIEADTQAISTAMQPALTFGDSDTLIWPVVGNVLVNFSMDKTVYFATLDQYKYNPAIIIEANVGDLITASAAGKVLSVFTDPQIGNAITMELGGGYEVTYGQLANILVSEGSFVAMGDVIAEVSAPTKYYSVEGTNVYFRLTKDGEPVNPMTRLS